MHSVTRPLLCAPAWVIYHQTQRNQLVKHTLHVLVIQSQGTERDTDTRLIASFPGQPA